MEETSLDVCVGRPAAQLLLPDLPSGSHVNPEGLNRIVYLVFIRQCKQFVGMLAFVTLQAHTY